MPRPRSDAATSRSGAMPNPELSRLSPPMKCDRAAAEHREAHVVDHLALVVLVDRDRPRTARPRPTIASVGNGNSVIGRTQPTRRPRPGAAHRGAHVTSRACRTRRRRPRRRRRTRSRPAARCRSSISAGRRRARVVVARRGRSRRRRAACRRRAARPTLALPVPPRGAVERPVGRRAARRSRSRSTSTDWEVCAR